MRIKPLNNRFTAFVLCVQMAVTAALGQDSGKKAGGAVLKNDACAEVLNDQSKIKAKGDRSLIVATPDEEVIKVQTSLVTVPLSVIDRAGRVALGLQMQHFEIFENGVAQKIEYFQAVDQPFTVILVIDVSPSTKLRFEQIKSEAHTFVSKLRPGDSVGVILFDRTVRVLTEPTSNRNSILNAIYSLSVEGGTSIYDAVDTVINHELPRIKGRKAVVLLTDGVDTTSSRATYVSTLRDVAESDTQFYTIRYDTYREREYDVGGFNETNTKVERGAKGTGTNTMVRGTNSNVPFGVLGVTLGEYQKGRRYMELLAEMTGGREFEAGSMYRVAPAFSDIIDELRRQYTVAYYPNPLGNPGERRQIKIQLKLPDEVVRQAVVRAKPCYIVAGPTETTK